VRRELPQQWRYLTRRPLKDPALVVFLLMSAVSPCSVVFTSRFVFDRFLVARCGILRDAIPLMLECLPPWIE